jgi:hypothetical protein
VIEVLAMAEGVGVGLWCGMWWSDLCGLWDRAVNVSICVFLLLLLLLWLLV